MNNSVVSTKKKQDEVLETTKYGRLKTNDPTHRVYLTNLLKIKRTERIEKINKNRR